jgi:hypothetical protein
VAGGWLRVASSLRRGVEALAGIVPAKAFTLVCVYEVEQVEKGDGRRRKRPFLPCLFSI